MNPEIERLFHAVVALPADQREIFLDENCSDPQIRREVELLLEHDAGSETFLQDAISNVASSVRDAASLREAQRVGAWEILALIGRGGMGAVYRARRADGKFEQVVAIKVLQDLLGSGLGKERLQQEYRILAALDHPNIARLLDAGVTEGGIPYFVMEFVDGVPIDKFCVQQGLTLPQRLRLFISVCDAVQYAHQKLVVHRDLKPDNILVTAGGITKLLDFGIAKVLSETPGAAVQTVTQALTPEYASPEQVRGEAISTASDIYSLGCVLYKMLTGVSPHQLQGVSTAEAVKIICEREMPDPRKFSDLPADMVHILHMALRKEPQRRYRSVEQFAGDIQNLLSGHSVLAGPDTLWYRNSRFARRNWVALTAVVTVLLALGIGAGVATWQARRAERRFADVRHLANVFLFDFEKSIHNVPGTTRARQLVVTTALEYLEKLSADAAKDPALAREVASAYEKVGDLQGAGMANIGNTAEAVRSFEKALALRRSLGDPQSATPGLRVEYGGVLVKLATVQGRTNQLDDAIRHYREAISIAEGALQSDPDSFASTRLLANGYMGLPFNLHRRSDIPGALDSAQRGLALRQKLAAALPQDRQAKQELANAYYVGADLQVRMEHDAEAVPGYEKALDLQRRLVSEMPDDIVARRQLMIYLNRFSFVQFSLAEGDKPLARSAVANAREAFQIADRAANADPANAEALSDLMTTAVGFGRFLSPVEAVPLLERAVRACQDLVRNDPGNRENRLNLALSRDVLADSLRARHDLAGALEQRRMAAVILQELSAQSPNDVKILHPYVASLRIQGDLLAQMGNWDAARRVYLQALKTAEEMEPKNPTFAGMPKDLKSRIKDVEAHRRPAP